MTTEEEQQLEAVEARYGEEYLKFNRHYMSIDYDTMKVWKPIIHGLMLGENIAEFFSKIDWSKTDADGIEGVIVEPPCGEMPRPVLLACAYAKGLAPEVMDSLLDGSRSDAIRKFHEAKRELLYGKDALSVIELFEDRLNEKY